MKQEHNSNDHHDNRNEQGDARRKHRHDEKEKNNDKSGDSHQKMNGSENNKSTLDRTERVIKVCELFLQGKSNREIVAWMKEKYGVAMTHRMTAKYMREAAEHDWLKLHPPCSYQLRGQMKRRYPWLEDLDVVHSSGITHIARRAAEILCKLVIRRGRAQEGRSVVRIGWSGGYQSRELAREFVRLLRDSSEDLPDEVVIHCLGSGVRIGDPSTDPKFIFLGLLDDFPGLKVDLRIVGFPGPGLVDAGQIDLETLMQWFHIREVMVEAERLDVIVTAAGSWSDEHSVFSQTMKSSPEAAARLVAAEVVGDMLWCPVGRCGPIETGTGLRYMTLVELKHLLDFIARGKKVLLMAGSCEVCCRPKDDVLKVLLELERHFFTHLVIDSYTARGVLLAA